MASRLLLCQVTVTNLEPPHGNIESGKSQKRCLGQSTTTASRAATTGHMRMETANRDAIFGYLARTDSVSGWFIDRALITKNISVVEGRGQWEGLTVLRAAIRGFYKLVQPVLRNS